ncbi:MAG: hypothetical protein ABFD91_06845 [Anaerohalosphaeraceae bacterium]
MKYLFSVALVAATVFQSSCYKEVKPITINTGTFNPKPLNDDWTRWMVGQWEGAGQGDAGKGTGHVTIELGLNGQFLFMRGEAQITGLNAEYLKKNMNASDDEIQRFASQPYRSLEIYTIDPATGDIVGYLFDSLRCVATGRGKRQDNKEIIEWQWATGHKSTRITEKADQDTLLVTERTYNMADGSVMEDKGKMIRCK